MGFAVELLFDTESEARIKSLWDAIAEATGNAYLLNSGSRPHLSLALFNSLEGVDLRDTLASFARSTAVFSLEFEAIGLFPGPECVVYLAPVVTWDLLETHAYLHRSLSELAVRSSDYYLPGRWIPHCTVAYDVSHEQVSEAIGTICGSGALGDVQVVEVALIEFEPTRHISSFPLTGGALHHDDEVLQDGW
jgi:2'-5' RNA ligase